MTIYAQRCDKLRKLMKKTAADALLVTDFVNVTYLTGFTGDDSYLLVHPGGETILTDPRYTEQIADQCPGLDVACRMPGKSMLHTIERTVQKARLGRLAFEAQSMTVATRDQIAGRLSKVELVPTTGLVEHLRQVKDKEEVLAIRRAVDLAQRAFAVVRNSLRPERTEREVAYEIEHQIRLFGGKECSFPAIVAVGPRAALPHAYPTDRRIGESDFVLIDWGAREELYVSDLTRVLVTGKISPKLERIYGVVLKAQLAAIDKIRPGAMMEEVHKAAADVIAKAGHAKHFGHSLGHGIGQQVHEAPRLAMGQRRPLRPGMVVTVEPGIYLPGWGGVRLEDDVLVTRSGHEVLSNVPKQFADCVVV